MGCIQRASVHQDLQEKAYHKIQERQERKPMTDKQETMCREILANYGTKKQEIQAVQELSELILVLTRRDEQRKDKVAFRDNLIDEIADCLIMIQQMKQAHNLFDIDVDMRINEKLLRQKERIRIENLAKGGAENG
jgi:hypothetical protein